MQFFHNFFLFSLFFASSFNFVLLFLSSRISSLSLGSKMFVCNFCSPVSTKRKSFSQTEIVSEKSLLFDNNNLIHFVLYSFLSSSSPTSTSVLLLLSMPNILPCYNFFFVSPVFSLVSSLFVAHRSLLLHV